MYKATRTLYNRTKTISDWKDVFDIPAILDEYGRVDKIVEEEMKIREAEIIIQIQRKKEELDKQRKEREQSIYQQKMRQTQYEAEHREIQKRKQDEVEKQRKEREKQERLKREQEEAIQKKLDLKKQEEIERIEQNIQRIEGCIRTRKKFNSNNPQQYKCNIQKLFISCIDISPSLPSFLEWLRSQPSFIVHGDTHVSLRYKTPYQGTDRRYGYYQCRTCNQKWTSGHSWKDCGQKCQKCEMFIYPHVQDPLIFNKSNKILNGPHDITRCERCIQLKHSCC
jgi:hypothetical protein